MPRPPEPRRFSVGLFCGSRLGADPAHAAAAEQLGREIGRRGWRLVYGGGEVGLMGTTARSAMAAGAEVLGIIPQRLLDREVGKRDISELRVTATMFERKEQLIQASDAFAVLPGGLGTLDEILDAVTLRQLGYHAKPILLIDLGGYWQPSRAVFERFVAAGFADASATRLYELVPNIASALLRLEDAAGALLRLEDAAGERGR
jgi:uncharacterized protein (TIGR00730 family)